MFVPSFPYVVHASDEEPQEVYTVLIPAKTADGDWPVLVGQLLWLGDVIERPNPDMQTARHAVFVVAYDPRRSIVDRSVSRGREGGIPLWDIDGHEMMCYSVRWARRWVANSIAQAKASDDAVHLHALQDAAGMTHDAFNADPANCNIGELRGLFEGFVILMGRRQRAD